MGVVILVIACDFRQILPVISLGTTADQINTCLKKFLSLSEIEPWNKYLSVFRSL